jgi:hypothetical protein
MKEEPDVKAVTQEASLLVTKAAELFLEALTAQALAADDAGGGANPAVLTYADLGARVAPHVVPVCMLRADASVAPAGAAAAVSETDRMDFLRDIVPPKVAAAKVAEGRAAD